MVALVWRTPLGTQATVTVQMDMREQTVNPLHAICHAQKWEGSAMQANVSASVDGLESTAISEPAPVRMVALASATAAPVCALLDTLGSTVKRSCQQLRLL